MFFSGIACQKALRYFHFTTSIEMGKCYHPVKEFSKKYSLMNFTSQRRNGNIRTVCFIRFVPTVGEAVALYLNQVYSCSVLADETPVGLLSPALRADAEMVPNRINLLKGEDLCCAQFILFVQIMRI
jgi:hypothetical protein